MEGNKEMKDFSRIRFLPVKCRPVMQALDLTMRALHPSVKEKYRSVWRRNTKELLIKSDLDSKPLEHWWVRFLDNQSTIFQFLKISQYFPISYY